MTHLLIGLLFGHSIHRRIIYIYIVFIEFQEVRARTSTNKQYLLSPLLEKEKH